MAMESLNFYSDSTCMVKTMNDLFLFNGIINEISYQDKVLLKIVPKEGEQLQFIEYGLPVKIVLRKQNKFNVISGNVYASSRELCSITDVANLQEKERRKYFRVSSSIHAQVSEFVDPELRDENYVEEFHGIKLMDISLTGIKFYSSHEFDNDAILEVSDLMLVSDIPLFTLNCHIVDKRPLEDGFVYRTILSDLSPLVTDLLCKAIFKLERNNAKKH